MSDRERGKALEGLGLIFYSSMRENGVIILIKI